MLNDAMMVGVLLALIFGAAVFYLYSRLSMAERKMGLFEGVLTDLKIMMDAAPFAVEEQIPPEYLSAISGAAKPVVEDTEIQDEEDYQQTLNEVLPTPPLSQHGAINVTKLSPDLDSMTVKELNGLAKQRGVSIPAGTRRKEIIELLKKEVPQTFEAVLEGPPLNFDGAPLDSA